MKSKFTDLMENMFLIKFLDAFVDLCPGLHD